MTSLLSADTVTDAFIKLKDAHVNLNHRVREICMRFGDKIPYEDVYVIPGVGNSANAASSAARLGLKTAFVSNVGDDGFGKEIIKVLGKEGIDIRFITVNSGKKRDFFFHFLVVALFATALSLHSYIQIAFLDSGFSPQQRVAALSASLSNGLVGHWKFDEGTGTSAQDSSENNNAGTLLNGPAWVDRSVVNTRSGNIQKFGLAGNANV